jgi:signal transduction histidine kinase
MKHLKGLFIIHTVFMLAVLLVLIYLFGKMGSGDVIVGSYSDDELAVYKRIWEDLMLSREADNDRIFAILIAFWSVLAASGYILLTLIYFRLIRPAQDMQRFSSEIAGGNLDIPLPVRRNNLFGSFTESFDMMREQLRVSRDREIKARKANRDLVAELSHDLKTPVATIQAGCEVLDAQLLRKKSSLEESGPVTLSSGELDSMIEKVSMLSDKASTINSLVENVFRATLDDMEEIRIETSEYDSKVLLDHIKSLQEYGNIILENDIPECLVCIDKLRMKQVIDNVVGNSRKYAGTDIRVSFGMEEISDISGKKMRFLFIRIADSGPGVKPEELPLVSEKYYRGKNTSEKQGYGLGLYLVRTYMERQGGGYECYNEGGFVVKLLVRVAG